MKKGVKGQYRHLILSLQTLSFGRGYVIRLLSGRITEGDQVVMDASDVMGIQF